MRHSRPILILALAAAVAACGGGTTATSGSPQDGAGAPPTSAPATAVPTEEPAPGTATPAASPSGAVRTEPPTAEATGTPPPDATSPGGDAAACSGSDANRSFFAAAAEAVGWPVLCAVLPKGWFVSEGSYRKANGGKVLVSYKGPGGATLALSEGAFCTGDEGCVPSGDDLGDAALGPLDGTLVGLDDGGFAIVAERGMSPSWLMVTRGLDQATTVALGAALAQVGS